MRILLNAVALTAFGLAGLGTAQAVRPEAPWAKVHYTDLDLSRRADVARLERRVAAALETVCGSYAGADESEMRDIDRCRAETRARARPMVAMLIAHEHTDLAQR